MPQPQPKVSKVAQAFAQGLQFHHQGKLPQAERLYAEVLAAEPTHFDGLQMMALVKLAKGEPAEALQLMSSVLKARRPSPQVLLNYGIILNALERHQEAIDSFDAALKQKSKYAEAYNNRGAALSSLGRDEEALESFKKALAIKPDYAEAHYNNGSSLRILGRYEEALKSFDRALALRPAYAKAHNNRGAVLEVMLRDKEALAAYERALALYPTFSEARINRTRVLCNLERFDEALDGFAQALALDPQDADSYYHRGRILIDLNRNDEAIEDFKKALAIRPDFAEARFAAVFAEVPILYADEAEIARRRAAYERSLNVLCEDVAVGRVGGDLVKALAVKQPFLLAYQEKSDCALQRRYGALVERIVNERYGPPPELPQAPAPGEPIRVGIVSSFFYLHSNWKIPIKGWLGQMDRSRFRLYGYHVGTRRDAETEAAARMCDRFVHKTLDVAGWRREILADRPHVLIYPGLWMDTITFQLAAQRLARVQCNSWGHPETSGMTTLDSFFSSDLMEPPDAAAHYTEQLVRLPNISVFYEPVETPPVAITRQELKLRPSAAVFWCGQSLFKYLPQYDHVFARIAKAAGDCQFVFVRHTGGPPVNELFQRRLDAAFAAEGLKASDHCVFLGRLNQSQFIAAIGQADVFLDSIGWSGCNSALESLAHNLPIVTRRGALMRGRHSAAILEMMGVIDTIADTLDDYIEIAACLAREPQTRRALSARIAASKHRLYRDRACVTALEDYIERQVRA
ncbi:MAG TPA: tetratricopeptide repeat protein [Pseudolabrys sp.]|nr:tetratricopeptide repeat protein [Pseudolabrys sp.]